MSQFEPVSSDANEMKGLFTDKLSDRAYPTSSDNNNTEGISRNRRAIIIIIASMISIIILWLILYLSWIGTYKFVDFITPFMYIVILLIFIVSFMLTLCLYYGIYYLIMKLCCKDKELYTSNAKYCCSYCMLYSIQITLWFLIITITLILYHPYWNGVFEVYFPRFKGFNSKNISVRSWPQTHEYSGELILPNNKDEIISFINNVKLNGKIVRPAGTGHHFNKILTNDYIISVENINHIQINISDESVLVGAGARVGDVEDLLHELGYILPGFGNAQYQRFGGMLGTGVGNCFGSMSKYATDIWLIDGNGNDVYINSDNVTLLNAARVNIGLLGVLYQIKFKIQPTFNIEYTNAFLDPNEFLSWNKAEFVDNLLPMSHISDDFRNISNDVLFATKMHISLTETDDNNRIYHIRKYYKTEKTPTELVHKTSYFNRNLYSYVLNQIGCVSISLKASVYKAGLKLGLQTDNIFPAKESLKTDHYFHWGWHYIVKLDVCQDALHDLLKISNKIRKDHNLLSLNAVVYAEHKNENNGFMSYMYDNDVCILEIYPNTCAKNRIEFGLEYEKIIIDKYNGSTHHGYPWNTYETFYKTKIFWSKFDEFNQIRKQFDPNNLFLNEYFYNLFEYDGSINSNIKDVDELYLFDHYAKNQKTSKTIIILAIIIPVLCTLIYSILNLLNVLPNYMFEKVGLKYYVYMGLGLITHILVAIVAVLFSRI